MTKVKPKKRVFKAWAVMRSNGQIEHDFHGLPMQWRTPQSARSWIKYSGWADRNSRPKPVTIIIED